MVLFVQNEFDQELEGSWNILTAFLFETRYVTFAVGTTIIEFS